MNSNSPEKIVQSTYVVAFLDFLGSQKMMQSAEDRDRLLQQMRAIYNSTLESLEEAPAYGKSPLKVRIFSDNIVFAKKVTTSKVLFEDIQYVSWVSAVFQAQALLKRLLVRGGISYGLFYCDDVFIYGEALAKAYAMESSRAIYPRVIVDNYFFNDTILTGGIRTVKENTFFKDFDGEWCVNFVSPNIITSSREITNKLLARLQENIAAMYRDNSGDAKLRQKYFWLVNSFNMLLDKTEYKEFKISQNIYGDPDTVLLSFLQRGGA